MVIISLRVPHHICSCSCCQVLEYMPGGDCFSLLRAVGCLPCDDARRFAADIVLALEYLHSLGIGALSSGLVV